MTDSTRRVSVAISASTTTASATLPAGSSKFIRVVNPTTALCYVTTGAGSATATAANIAVGAYSTVILEKPDADDTVAVLLSASTGTIAVSLSGAP